MKIYSFKIITNYYQDSRKLLEEGWFTKKIIKKNPKYVSVKNNFIFFKSINPKDIDTKSKRINFLNKHLFIYAEPNLFYKTNKFLIQKNLFFDYPNVVFFFDRHRNVFLYKMERKPLAWVGSSHFNPPI